ncbi:MAG: acyltransferase [Hyphomonadaceae bacterium]|nr:acyltransferase [Hyphomonadaceae bacterium]
MGLVRVTLALAVLLSHLPIMEFKFISGALAVQSFFIVSGFYMALVLEGKYKDARLFYSNRLLRLFPTYFLCCILAALTTWVFMASPTASPEIFATIFSDPLTAAIMVFENIFLVGQELLFWFTVGPDGALRIDTDGVVPDETTLLGWQGLLVPQSWSLSMELMFYALAPWLARAGWKWIAAIALLSIALRLAGAFLPIDYLLWQGRFFPTALFLFLLGMLAHKALPLAARLPRWTGWIVNALLLAFLILHPMLQEALSIEPVRGRWIVYAVVAAAIPFVFATFKDFAWDRWIGDLSYPIYLTQLMTIGLVLTYEPPFAAAVAILGTIALSALVLVLVEHPLDRWRQQRVRRARPEAVAAPSGASPAPL